MVRSLRRMPYAQAKIRDYSDIGRDMIILQSYATDVIIIDNGFIECTGLYSMTTRKHISAFLWEVCPNISFQQIKSIAGTGKKLGMLTGRVVG